MLMKFVCISDVHIKEPEDLATTLFLAFLRSPQTKESQIIFLLGDIFDLLVGGHQEYFEKHSVVFEELIGLIQAGKKIVQFEGNHDFHFKKLVKMILAEKGIPEQNWSYKHKPLVLDINGNRTLFAHGDEIEIENINYKIYKTFIRSLLIKVLANHIVPFHVVDNIGKNASKKSRERNVKSYSDMSNNHVKDKFRRSFLFAQKKYKVRDVICGHSHCLDNYNKNGLYLNNGFFPGTRTFTFFNGFEYSQVLIDQLVD
ncbi:MAG: UDP-2,3-diacylglucosamine diphosphatase [Bacteriovoracaceae bacterium]|nr:UDP-2,3-diacylglucosamine diphosphatase [Bacteriovoracaceae bacterium]